MREIKFRAWDGVRNEYLSGGCVLLEIGAGRAPKLSELHLDSIGCKCNERIILEQFTGLKDCNGVEIYEGDWLKPKNSEIFHGGQVRYSDYFAAFVIEVYKFSQPILCKGYIEINDLVVAGNIHENPELLEAK